MAKTTKKPTAKQIAARKKFAAMAKARAKAKKTAVKKAKVYQTGTSKVLIDKKKKAKSPGKRVSATGGVYYERRKNRSNMPGSLTGIGALKKTALTDCTNKLGKLHAAKLQETTKRGKAALQKQINEVNKKVKQLGKL